MASRAKRLDEILQRFSSSVESAKSDYESALDTLKEDAKSEVEELKDEIENWKSGLEGTNLENSQKYSDLDDCVNELENVIDQIDNVDADNQDCPDGSSVNFPGMYS